MKKLNRRHFLKWIGVISVSTGVGICGECSADNHLKADKSKYVHTDKKTCPHRFCRHYHPISGETNEKGYCYSKAFKNFRRS